MQSSRIVLAIVQPDAASYATIADMEASLNQHAAQADCYYLLNRYEPREAFAIDTTALLREQFGDRLAPIAISRDEGFREALALQQTSLQYDPHSQASHDIDQLSRWLLERLSRAGQR